MFHSVLLKYLAELILNVEGETANAQSKPHDWKRRHESIPRICIVNLKLKREKKEIVTEPVKDIDYVCVISNSRRCIIKWIFMAWNAPKPFLWAENRSLDFLSALFNFGSCSEAITDCYGRECTI